MEQIVPDPNSRRYRTEIKRSWGFYFLLRRWTSPYGVTGGKSWSGCSGRRWSPPAIGRRGMRPGKPSALVRAIELGWGCGDVSTLGWSRGPRSRAAAEEEDGGDMWELARLGVGAMGKLRLDGRVARLAPVLLVGDSGSRRPKLMVEDGEQPNRERSWRGWEPGWGTTCRGLKEDGEWRGAAAWRREWGEWMEGGRKAMPYACHTKSGRPYLHYFLNINDGFDIVLDSTHKKAKT
jgi:hypothetical protein